MYYHVTEIDNEGRKITHHFKSFGEAAATVRMDLWLGARSVSIRHSFTFDDFIKRMMDANNGDRCYDLPPFFAAQPLAEGNPIGHYGVAPLFMPQE